MESVLEEKIATLALDCIRKSWCGLPCCDVSTNFDSFDLTTGVVVMKRKFRPYPGDRHMRT